VDDLDVEVLDDQDDGGAGMGSADVIVFADGLADRRAAQVLFDMGTVRPRANLAGV
jgi:hypothetical protein